MEVNKMLLRTQVENQEIEFRFDKPKHTSWILNYYFSEFRIKVNMSNVNEEENSEKTKLALISIFESLADFQSQQLDGNEIVFLFRYKELIGIPFLDAFEDMARLQGKLIIEKLNEKAYNQLFPYHVEITIESLYPYRGLQ
jgi:hypothetical protein